MSTTSLGILVKDPNEIRTFYMDWSAHLPAQRIVVSAWAIEPVGSLVMESNSVLTGNTKTSITVSGGTARTEYYVTNTVTTTTGQVYERTGTVSVRQK